DGRDDVAAAPFLEQVDVQRDLVDRLERCEITPPCGDERIAIRERAPGDERRDVDAVLDAPRAERAEAERAAGEAFRDPRRDPCGVARLDRLRETVQTGDGPLAGVEETSRRAVDPAHGEPEPGGGQGERCSRELQSA